MPQNRALISLLVFDIMATESLSPKSKKNKGYTLTFFFGQN